MENIYSKYNIDRNRLKRDYIQYPLKKEGKSHRYELPYREDLKYLYIELNLTKQCLCNILGVKCVDTIIKQLNIQKPRDLVIQNTNKSIQEKYGRSYFQTEEFKSLLSKPKSEKWKNTQRKNNMLKYGVENVFQLDKVKEKIKKTNLKKYGSEYFVQSKEYKKLYKDKDFISKMKTKEYQSKKKNNSFTVSKPEEEIYKSLCSKFHNVIHQYRSELYPFNCDFYIPEIDLYIEYQGHWTHGNEPYIGTNEQNEILEIWRNKSNELNFKGRTKNQYKRAIKIWTLEDPLKRKTVKENNLNWIEFFNMNEFLDWFNHQ